MANIATVATAAFLRRDVRRGQVTPHAMLRAMSRFKGRSYCVPPWSYDDYPHRRIYTQHGEPWSPTGVHRAWERYGRFMDALWVRWFDDGGDHDAIFVYSAGGASPSTWCRYGFDRVRVRGSPALGGSLSTSVWWPDGPESWAADIRGSYLAANDRSDLLTAHPALPSRTTPVRGRTFSPGTLRWAADEMPAELTRIEPAVLADGSDVELQWRGRATRVYQRRGQRWWGFCLDDWDNCVADGWLAAAGAP